MSRDRLQTQRFELKFHVSPRLVSALRDFVRCHLNLDEYSARQRDFRYPVHSLYLDTDDKRLCRHTIHGLKNRFKLRIRYYDEEPSSPVFFEIKRRQNDCILKQRACVRRECAAGLLAGDWPEACHLVEADEHGLEALHAFHRTRMNLGAKPCAHVAYQREAWLSRTNDNLRITFDSAVCFEPEQGTNLSTRFNKPYEVFLNEVILEVKFVDRFPAWIAELVQSFSLVRGSAAKYVEGTLRSNTFPDEAPHVENLETWGGILC